VNDKCLERDLYRLHAKDDTLEFVSFPVVYRERGHVSQWPPECSENTKGRSGIDDRSTNSK